MKKKISAAVKKTGVWLDFKNAYLFTITGDNDPVMEKIESPVEFRVRFAGEKENTAQFRHTIIGEREKKQHRQTKEKARYYQKILSAIRDSNYIYVFGPGEAKEGLRNAIKESTTLRRQLAACETADKLTIRQMKQKVLQFFSDEKFMMVGEMFETLKK